MAATYCKALQFVEDLAHKVHNLGADQLKVSLTNTAPTGYPAASSTTDTVLDDITPIAYTNLTSLSGANSNLCEIERVTSSVVAGLYTLTLNDIVFTASDTAAAFRYVVIYNDTPTSPEDPLIAFFDYGSSVTLGAGESFTVDFAVVGSGGLFTLE